VPCHVQPTLTGSSNFLCSMDARDYMDGFWYVSANMAGIPEPLVAVKPTSVGGMVCDVIFSLVGE